MEFLTQRFALPSTKTMAPNSDNSIAMVYFNPSTVSPLLNEFEISVQLGKFFARLSSDTAQVL
jgi:hypothetical protein